MLHLCNIIMVLLFLNQINTGRCAPRKKTRKRSFVARIVGTVITSTVLFLEPRSLGTKAWWSSSSTNAKELSGQRSILLLWSSYANCTTYNEIGGMLFTHFIMVPLNHSRLFTCVYTLHFIRCASKKILQISGYLGKVAHLAIYLSLDTIVWVTWF